MLTKESIKSKLFLCAAALSALSAVGCASDDLGADEAVDGADALGLQVSGSEKGIDVDGAYFASIKTNGTGCPAGTANTEISKDGKTFTTTFSAFEAVVDNRAAVAVKDCMLAIKLHSPSGMSFSVSDFFYQGYAYLEPGQTGRQIAKYYFQGAPLTASEVRTNLKGPYDDTYTFNDTVVIADNVWSPCGVNRDLNIQTIVRLQNSRPGKDGYMNLGVIDGSTDTKIRFKLNWRRCN